MFQTMPGQLRLNSDFDPPLFQNFGPRESDGWAPVLKLIPIVQFLPTRRNRDETIERMEAEKPLLSTHTES